MKQEQQPTQNAAQEDMYYPSAEIVAQANVKDPEALRKEAAKDIQSY